MRLTILLLSISIPLFAQSISARNWLDYRGATEGHSHFEDRAWLSANWGDFSGGLLFWAKQPSRITPDGTDTTSIELAQYWMNYYSPNIELTAGSFTRALGQGLILDLYERPDIQIDHHCDGASFNIHLSQSDFVSGRDGFLKPRLDMGGFNGIAHWDNEAIVRGGEIATSLWKFRLGGEYAKILPVISAHQELWGAFGGLSLDFLSLYAEYGHKKPLGGLAEEGEAKYASCAAMIDKFSLTLEYKDYKEFATRTPTILYNNPPKLIREPYYTLPSLHLRELNADNEKGYMSVFRGTIWRISPEISYSHAEQHDGKNKFDQIWAEIEYSNEDETFIAKMAADYERGEDDTLATPILDITWEPEWTLFAFNIIGEFQPADSLNNIFGSLSISYSPYMTLGAEGGTIENESFVRGFADIDIIERTKIRLGYGKRPGGFTCSGGVCRYESAFEGVEFQMILTY